LCLRPSVRQAVKAAALTHAGLDLADLDLIDLEKQWVVEAELTSVLFREAGGGAHHQVVWSRRPSSRSHPSLCVTELASEGMVPERRA
jgi:hypothetical protein